MKKKYFAISNKRLAEALAYLTYDYYKFNRDDGKVVYSFEDSVELREDIMMLKKARAKRNTFNF